MCHIDMDDSDQDFVDLCSRLLKRNRKKTVDHRQQKKPSEQHKNETTAGEKRRKKNNQDFNAGSQSSTAVSGTQPVCSGPVSAPAVSAEGGTRAKDKVLLKMQQFKRASPQRMALGDNYQPTEYLQESNSTGVHPKPVDSDEALAMRLQRELDREAHPDDLEDEGLFFCQLCNKDLSHMTPEGRTQHINRCLDEREDHAAPPQPPAILECPICGKRFKSLKSRSTHLKRCSSDMGVAPAVLMQVLQRQAEEAQSTQTSNQISQTGGNKRKGSKSNMPASKKPRKKVEELDEDTMVAMALSSSLLEKEKQTEAEREIIIETVAANPFKSPNLKWKAPAGKGRSKKKKGGIPRPPPLLLHQDTEAALARIQERVSALLCSHAPSPPTPTRCPSSLSDWSGAASLWHKSALLADGASPITDFYTPELRDFIVHWESAKTMVTPAAVQAVKMGTPFTTSRASILPSSSHMAHYSSPTVSTPGCSQALRDLMELAEDGMTLTQYGYTETDLNKGQQRSTSQTPVLNSSGFVPEDNIHKQRSRIAVYNQVDEEGKYQSVSLSRLALDLGSMVNNPQLSDVQLQVDSGEVYFAHSFMVYTRCPLMAEMFHESGFGVQEEGVPAAQRVLLNDVPGQAVFALLQYLYTAHCSFPTSLQPHVLELASRFDLKDLQDLCQLQEEALLEREDTHQEQDPNNKNDQAFIELLRSMWNDEDEENEGADDSNGSDDSKEMDDQSDALRLGDREIHDEQVNEEELVEIYEFAATQKKREEQEDSLEELKHVNNQEVFPTEVEDQPENVDRSTDTSLDRSYNRLFSQSWGNYEEKEISALPLDTESKSRSKQHRSTCLVSDEMSGRTLLQSSASVIDKQSLSPSPTAQNMPVPGLSPALSPCQVDFSDKSNTEILNVSPGFRDESVKRKSQGTTKPIRVKISPHSSPQNNEPELVVLSDSSSEDMKIDLTQSSPSPENMHSANIKESAHYSSIEKINGELSSSSAHQQLSDCEVRPVDCSAEVSWLIPSTPVQSGSVRNSSSQTKSSICRTQLFPRGDGSLLSLSHSPQSPDEGSLDTNLLTGSISKTALPLSSLDMSDRKGRVDFMLEKKLDSSGFAVPLSPAKHLYHSNHSISHLGSSKQDTPLHFPAYSSTPVHTEHTKPPIQLPDSPFSAEKVLTQEETEVPFCPSPENAEIQSFHLLPLPERSSSSHSSTKTNNISCNKSKFSEEGDRDIVNELKTLNKIESRKDISEDGGGECSFRDSFMDEPPIAFNDSWGLDACAENPACFSLKLEDSGESGQQEDSPGKFKGTNLPTSSTNTFSSPNRKSLTSIRAHAMNTYSSPASMPPDGNNSLLDKIWNSWDEEDEEKDVTPPLLKRLKPPAQHKTPVSIFKNRQNLVPITPMPHYSDMDTPDLKNKLNKFGVRPLPKRQMILKLKEIHQYTHQLVSSDEDESPPVSCAHTSQFKQPKARAAPSPQKPGQDNDPDALSASQGSSTSSTAESERSNPEIVQLSDGDSDSDGGISASQAASRLQDRLQAVRAFILSNSNLYNQILQYQPLVLSQFQQQLKAAGIRLGVSKLADYLDSQCITFTTAKPGQSAPNRRFKKTKGAAEGGVRRKKPNAARH